VLGIWNQILKCEERSLADAVDKFVKDLGLPSTLREVGVTKQDDINKVAKNTVTDIIGAMEGMDGKEDVMAILESAKGGSSQDGADDWLDGGAPM
jgi:alcohol dehydrogenase class IV